MNNKLTEEFGGIDIYLFDQLLKGRYDKCKTILDVGCGGGRNLVYFLRKGFEVYGVDRDPNAIAQVKVLAEKLSDKSHEQHFFVSPVENMPFTDSSFQLAICSAVLHFANDAAHFDKMLRSIWRVLAPGGFLFARLASDIGIEGVVKPTDKGKYVLPDGSIRFLVNHETLIRYTHELDGELYEPIKTTNVSGLRCMTTWCIQKNKIPRKN